MPRYLTSYPSRVKSGSTSLLTPNLATFKHLEVPYTAVSEVKPTHRPRHYPRDPNPRNHESDSDDDRPAKRRGGGRGDSPEREDVEVDDRGFVISVPPLDPDSDEAIGKFRYRQPGWIRVRSDYVLEKAAQTEDNLIPIRLDLDINGEYKLKDVFLWNLNEELITPTEFAVNLVTDLNLPKSFIPDIARDIRKQLAEYSPVALTELPFAKTAESHDKSAPVVVNLDVHLSRHLITDKFEWDLCNPHSIEHFVKITCADLGLFGEFNVALSCAIREELMRLKKEVIESPHGLAGLVEIQNDCAYDEPAGIRVCPESLGMEWTPSIEILTREEIEERDKGRDRIVRRLRRDTSRFTMLSNANPSSSTGAGAGSSSLSTPAPKRRNHRRDAARFDSPIPGTTTTASGTAGHDLSEPERAKWKCANCRLPGPDAWVITGAKNEYCGPCGDAVEAARNGATMDDRIAGEEKGRWRRGLYSSRYLINNPNWSGGR